MLTWSNFFFLPQCLCHYICYLYGIVGDIMLKENITSLKSLPEFETSKSGQILPNHPSLTGMSNAIALLHLL